MDIRAIKCSLGMDVLRCKSPEMVRKEIWASLLAYNLIRQTMLQAAYASGRTPRCMEPEPVAADGARAAACESSSSPCCADGEVARTADTCAAACESNSSPRCLEKKTSPAAALCLEMAESVSSPRQLSFTAALQKLAAGWVVAPSLTTSAADELRWATYKHMLKHRVGNRPDRVEPRAIKRRPKSHKLLTQPRAEARRASSSRVK